MRKDINVEAIKHLYIKKGAQCFRRGFKRSDNPYNFKTTEKGRWWDDGYVLASRGLH